MHVSIPHIQVLGGDCACVMGQHLPSQDGSPSHSGPADTPSPRISCHIQPAKDHFEISMGGSRI